MIIDRYNELSDAQAFAAITARTVATNIIDLLAAGDGFGCIGDGAANLHLRSLTAASGTATSVTITLETHTAADFSSQRTVLASVTTTIAAMTAGKILAGFILPFGLLRYVTLVVTPAGGNLTGSIDAFVNSDLQRNDFRTNAVGQPG